MGCGASVEKVVEGKKEKFDQKIETLEDEMRDIQMKINTEEKVVKRLKTQGRTQEAAAHIQKVKTLQDKLSRTRGRVNRTDRNKETLDKRLDQSEDIADLKETEKLMSKIKIDYGDALKVEDKIRDMDDKMDAFDDMVTDTATEKEVMTAVTKDIEKARSPKIEKEVPKPSPQPVAPEPVVVEKKQELAPPKPEEMEARVDKTSEGFQIMNLVAQHVRSKNWIAVVPLCDQLIAKNFDLLQSFSYKGKAQFYLEAYEDSIISFGKALENVSERNFVKKSKLYFIRAMAWQKEGNDDKAMEDFLAAETENPRNWMALCELGKLYHKNGKNDEAAGFLKKAYTYSNYECAVANELIKKIKKGDSMMEVVKSKKSEITPEKCFAIPTIKQIARFRHVERGNETKYLIQSYEYSQRCLTVNPSSSSKLDQIVLYNKVGSSANQQWIYLDDGVVVSVLNGMFLAFDDHDNVLYLSDDLSKKRHFFIQDKFLVCQTLNKTMVLDIKEGNNPGDVLMEMDLIGKGQRNSQYFRFIPFEEIARQNELLRRQKIEQQKRLQLQIAQQKLHEQQNFQQQQQSYVMQSLGKLLKLSIDNKWKKLNKKLKKEFADTTNSLTGIEGINDINPKNGNSVLINAIGMNAQESVRLLLEGGANPNQANAISGATPLHLCVCWDRPHMMMMLRSAGANSNLLDRAGLNCYHYVKKFGKPEYYVNLLRKPMNSTGIVMPQSVYQRKNNDSDSDSDIDLVDEVFG